MPIKLKNILELSFVFIYAIIGVVEIFLVMNFSNTLNPIFFDTFLSSEPNEAIEFMQSYFSFSVALAVFGFIGVSILFFYFPIKFSPKPLNPKIYFALFLIISIAIFSKGTRYLEPNKFILGGWFVTIKDGVAEQNSYLNEFKELAKILDTQMKKDYNLTIKSQIPKVVLILGESTQRNYQSLYGFKLDTTPNLNALKASGNLFEFSDTIAPESHTNPALAKLLTFNNYENSQSSKWYEHMNIIDLMKIAGYKTQWFSNQEAVSIWGNIPEVISSRADIREFTRVATSLELKNDFDEKLLNLYQKHRVKTDREFHIFHLMGTHMAYAHRFDKNNKNVRYFDMDELKNANLDIYPNGDKISNEGLKEKLNYINAIAYNDYIVSEIFKLYKDENAIIFYISDHADEVYDFREFKGHTSTMASRYMIEIPFIIYTSDKFKSSNPQLIQKIQKAQNRPFMSDDFIHGFMDILGIFSDDLDLSRSLFSDEFDANRIRIFSGKDYDKELKIDYPFASPSKIYLHRTDEPKKMVDFKNIYQNFEIDVHFIDGYFDVGHDGKKYSIGLNLKDMLQIAKNQNGGGYNADYARIWLDFKNLTKENEKSSLKELDKICDEIKFDKSNLIIESSNYQSLKSFKQNGYYTSYYVPYYSKDDLSNNKDKIINEINQIIQSGNISALSFAYYLYDFIKEAKFKIDKNGKNIDIDLLTWNEGDDYNKNSNTKAFYDPQVKVILAGAKKKGYR